MVTATLFFLLHQLFAYTSANPGFSTRGIKFVVALPSTRYDKIAGFISFSTEGYSASVGVFARNHSVSTDNWRTTYYSLAKYESASHPISGHETLRKCGIYKAIIIKSETLIRVALLIIDSTGLVTESYRAMPENSCYRSYYVTTALGNPSLMIMSFASPTNVRIQFPPYDNTFDEKCNASANCAPGKNVTVKLQPYKVWYFHLSSTKIQFQNTLIQSDAPIFVVSGSTLCLMKEISKDSCLTNMIPTVSWGKEYVVPNIHLTENVSADAHTYTYRRGNLVDYTPLRVYLRMNAKEFPLNIAFHSTWLQNSTVIKDHQGLLELNTEGPWVVRAEVPFGLYLFCPPNSTFTKYTAGLLSLIPIEQWMDGLVFVASEWDNVLPGKSYFLVIQTSTDGLRLNNDVWSTSKLRSYNGSKLYAYTSMVDLRRIQPNRIFTTNPKSKIMLYLRGTTSTTANFLLPYDHYQGAIYYPACKKYEQVANDGIDNDCDGNVDEEVLNNKDDDGDGSIDEDTREILQNGKWGKWKTICNITCGAVLTRQRVRACGKPVPSRFGKDCPGSNMTCEPGGTCPKDCNTVCECQDGCNYCREKNACTSCKANYLPGDYCLRPCPSNWSGIGCVRGPRDKLDKDLENIDYDFSLLFNEDNDTDDDDYDSDSIFGDFISSHDYQEGKSWVAKGKKKSETQKKTIALALLFVFVLLLTIATALLIYFCLMPRKTKKDPEPPPPAPAPKMQKKKPVTKKKPKEHPEEESEEEEEEEEAEVEEEIPEPIRNQNRLSMNQMFR